MFWQSISTWLELFFWFALFVWGVAMVFYGIVGGAVGIIRSFPAWLICLLVLLAISRFV